MANDEKSAIERDNIFCRVSVSARFPALISYYAYNPVGGVTKV